MNTALIPQLAVVNGHPTTTSRDVAEAFSKRHDNVMRDIRNRLPDMGAWGLLNFEESSYLNEQGKLQPCFRMTKDGFVFVVQKFSGAQATRMQIAYIERFNAMEAALTPPRPALPRTQPGYMREAWFAILRQQALVMQRRALARAVGVHESTLSQILNGTGKYGAGLAGTARIAAKVLRVFRALVQPRQLVLL